ncbi:MAG: hypothetical protein R2777_06895 [Chitinophagales bacterium]
MKKQIKHIAIILLAILGISFALNFNWWFWGSLSQFKQWYSNLGTLVWLFKYILIFLFLCCFGWSLYIVFKYGTFILKKIPFYYKITLFLFVGYLVVSPILNGNHPFSTFPMYNILSEGAYNFVLQDKNGEVVPYNSISKYTSIDVPDLYEAFLTERNIPYGNQMETKEQLNLVGDYLINILIDEDKRKKQGYDYIQLNRLYFTIENDKIVTFKTTLSEKTY